MTREMMGEESWSQTGAWGLGEVQLPGNQTNCLFVQVMRALVLNSNETAKAKAKAIFKDLFFLFVFEFSFLSPRIQSLCLPLNVALS